MADLFPQSIKIGPFNASIEWHKDNSEFDGAFGEYRNGRILVATSMPRDWIADTLWHEAGHAMWEMAGLPGRASEEQVLRSLSPIQLMVMRDNPALMEYLIG